MRLWMGVILITLLTLAITYSSTSNPGHVGIFGEDPERDTVEYSDEVSIAEEGSLREGGSVPVGSVVEEPATDLPVENEVPEYEETTDEKEEVQLPHQKPVEIPAENQSVTFAEMFDEPFVIKESGRMGRSSSDSWWVSSGGYFYSVGGIGSTIIGDLPEYDERRTTYAKTNPRDTDNGFHPQNIFRLVQKDTWENSVQEAYFRIVGNNFSDSKYRNQSNGLLFFNRYQDQFNLYYVGIRVDGHATIKKKINGVYYDLSYVPLGTTDEKYDRGDNPSSLPADVWIGLRSITETNDDGVHISLYVDWERSGDWELVAEAVDDGKSYGGPVFEEGHAGIRTDFMDVQFDDYSVTEIEG